MPVIRRGNQDRIDVLTVEDTTIVFIAVDLRTVAGEALDSGVEPLLEHITGGHEGVVRRFRKGREHLVAAATRSDDGEPHAFVCSQTAGPLRLGGKPRDRRSTHGGAGSEVHELSTVHRWTPWLKRAGRRPPAGAADDADGSSTSTRRAHMLR